MLAPLLFLIIGRHDAYTIIYTYVCIFVIIIVPLTITTAISHYCYTIHDCCYTIKY